MSMRSWKASVVQLALSHANILDYLHFWALHRVEVQPLSYKLANRLSTWKDKFVNKAGRLRLLNIVVSLMPTYFLTVFHLKKWAMKRIDKIRRGFLWKKAEQAHGGHCLVWWAKVQKPKKLGGLGILYLELSSRALWLRWLWYQRTEPNWPWVGTEVPCSEVDKQLFRVCTTVNVGNGLKAKFGSQLGFMGRHHMTLHRIFIN